MFPRPTMLIGYFMSDNLLISRHVRKTIEYIEKKTERKRGDEKM